VIFLAEIIYRYPASEKVKVDSSFCIRWLGEEELPVFNDHLGLCGQAEIDLALWDKIWQEGTRYAGLFVDSKMVARACVEKYSAEAWEVADVRVVREYRGKMFAFAVCSFVLNYILENERIPTIRTEEDNFPMQKVIANLGFIAEP
jgi:RimJ/RimL family protein N-acetyltransferase